MNKYTSEHIYRWFNEQKFQTADGEQEYKMCFVLDMPKIINKFLEDHGLDDNPRELHFPNSSGDIALGFIGECMECHKQSGGHWDWCKKSDNGTDSQSQVEEE